jgi:hypothetical protein
VVAFAEVDGEDGIDLQALLGAAADLEEAGDGTSRHSLDLPAGYDFEVRAPHCLGFKPRTTAQW